MIINLAEKRKAKEIGQTLEGRAKCISCSSEWQASAPLGTIELECPICHLMKGLFVCTVEQEDPHWVCNCGSSIFKINTYGVYCINCGVWQDGFLDTIERV